MAIGKKDVKASEQIIQAQKDREKNITELKEKIVALKVKSKAAAERMGRAAEVEALEEYSAAKGEKAFADDAVDLYQERLKSINESPLFGAESSAMLGKLNAEQDQIEIDAMNEIIPLLTKAWNIANEAKAKYITIGELTPVLCEHTGISVTLATPSDLVGVLRALGFYVDSNTRSLKGWK